jgi:hypothetical protein
MFVDADFPARFPGSKQSFPLQFLIVEQSEADLRPSVPIGEMDGEEGEASTAQNDCLPIPYQPLFMATALIYSEPALPSAILANAPNPTPNNYHWTYSDMALPQVWARPKLLPFPPSSCRVVQKHLLLKTKIHPPNWAANSKRKVPRGRQHQNRPASSPKVNLL